MTSPDRAESPVARAAFDWVTGLLDAGGFPWVVVGGLAARAYGSPRALADVDLDVPAAALAYVAQRAPGRITFGPARFVDAEFDIELLTLQWGDQSIDLAAAEDIRLFDRRRGQWSTVPTDLGAVESRFVLGRSAPVMARSRLIAYKQIIDRSVDRFDVRALLEAPVR